MKTIRKNWIYLIAFTTVCLNVEKAATQAAFTSSINGSWNDGATWGNTSPGTPGVDFPASTDTATILANDTITISSSAGIGKLTIDSAGHLSGTANFTITSDVINNSTKVMLDAKLIMNGSNAQKISGSWYVVDWETANSNGVTIDTLSSVEVEGTITLTNGELKTNDLLTLVHNDSARGRIGPIVSGGTIADKVTTQLYISGSTDGFRNISYSSVLQLKQLDDDVLMTGFPGSSFPDFGWVSCYTYDESVFGTNGNGWTTPDTITDTVKMGEGLYVYLTPTTCSWTGIINQGNLSLPVTFTDHGNVNNDGWNLVGNPYPSAIVFDSLSRTNVENLYWYYNSEAGNYADWNGSSAIGTNGANGYLAANQGFFVHADTVDPVLSIEETAKCPSDSATFKSPTKGAYYFTLKIQCDSNSYYDETILGFNEAGTEKKDNLDAMKFSPSPVGAPSIGSKSSDGVWLSINTIGTQESVVSVPLKMVISKFGGHTIEVSNISRISDQDASCILLEDKDLGTFIDLRQTASFAFTQTNSSDPERFVVHFYPSAVKTKEDISCNNAHDGLIIARGTGTGPYDFVWKDEDAVVLKTSTGIVGSDSLTTLDAGLYTVEVSSASGQCSYADVLIDIEEPLELSVSTNVVDAQCYNSADGQITIVSSGGTGEHSISWSNGSDELNLIGLNPGSYSYNVEDENGCTKDGEVEIGSPEEIEIDIAADKDTVWLESGSDVQFYNNTEADSFLWDFGNGSSSSVGEPTATYTIEGDYLVTMVAYRDDCADTSSLGVAVRQGVSNLEEISTSNWKVWANNGQIVVDFGRPTKKAETVSLYNQIGQLLTTVRVESGSTRVSLAPSVINSTSSIMVVRASIAQAKFLLLY